MPLKKKRIRKAKSAVEPVRKINRRDACPDCGSANIIFDSTMERLICHDCGVLFEELHPDMGEGYRRFL